MIDKPAPNVIQGTKDREAILPAAAAAAALATPAAADAAAFPVISEKELLREQKARVDSHIHVDTNSREKPHILVLPTFAGELTGSLSGHILDSVLHTG